MGHSAIQQYEYHKWANKRIFKHLHEVPVDLISNEITSVFSSLQEVLVHMYMAEGMWLSVISGDDFSDTVKLIGKLKEKSANKDLNELNQLFEELSDEFSEFLQNHNDLDKAMTINHPSFGELTAPASELVLHVVNHGTYHRGNITAMLRQQGQKGVSTDYIFFLYEKIKNT